MSVKDGIKKFMFLDDDDEITEEEIAEEEERQAKEKKQKKEEKKEEAFKTPSNGNFNRPKRNAPLDNRFSVTNPNGFKLVLIEPTSYEETPKLVDSLKGRRPIIVNLEKIENDVARKIFDFLSGATYALDGHVQKISNNIFIFAPENIDVSATNNEDTKFEYRNNGSPWKK